MRERIKAWQCMGCGRIEGAAPCVGVCRDVPVELVDARIHDAALARVERLEAALRRIAHTTPRPSGWELSYAAMQAIAKQALEADAP